MTYNASFLDNLSILSTSQKEQLATLSEQFSLANFLARPRLVEKLGFDFIYSSAQIEGNTYTKADTLELLEAGITAGGKKYSDAKMILNLKEAFGLMMSKNINIDLAGVKDIHKIISEGLVLKQNEGAMRNINIDGITGSSYIPLAYGEKLNDEMKYLFAVANDIKNPFEKAIYLHNNIAYLQYFEDCNKRTARAMQFAVLKNSNIMPLIIIDDDKSLYKEYRQAMIDYYESGKYDSYICFFMRCYEREFEYLKDIKK